MLFRSVGLVGERIDSVDYKVLALKSEARPIFRSISALYSHHLARRIDVGYALGHNFDLRTAYSGVKRRHLAVDVRHRDSSEVITQIPAGTQVKVTYDYNNDYGGYRKVTYNDQTGYIEGYYLMDDD